jgi:hypothetical protein
MEGEHKKIEIEPRGSFFTVDEEGYIVNPASKEKIQEEYKPMIADIIAIYKKVCGEHLKHVYIRGSVAKGEATPYISDVDSFAYVDLPEAPEETDAEKALWNGLEEKYDFIKDIEAGAYPLSDIQKDTILLNQSVCVYGEPIVVPRVRVGRELAIHSPKFRGRLGWYEDFLKNDENQKEYRRLCVNMMKALLRVGFEITIERSQKYTRDLYLCYKTFAEYYPEKEPQMREVLELALNPISDKIRLQNIIENIGAFLVAEIPNYIEVKDQ